jgi:hypothetical protein
MSRRPLLTRRRLLGLGAAAGAALLAGPAVAIGPSSRFRFAQLVLGAGGNPRPRALRRMAWEIATRTSIEIDPEKLDPVLIDLVPSQLAEHPFLYLAGDREFPMPSEKQIAVLRRYLTFGGFLLIDSAEGTTDGAFDGSVRQLIDILYPHPQKGLELLARDHVIYKSFYLVDRPHGRVAVSPTMEAVFRDERAVIAYCHNDLGGAWQRDELSNWEYACEPGGERQRENAFRLGTNLVMYAMCLDYKDDQAHVPFIMRRRDWRPDDGATEER